MKIINIGSLNIDHVYSVDHIVAPGETQAATGYMRNIGGKGCNQSIALARAGVTVSHAGKVGSEGDWLLDYLTTSGVDTGLIDTIDTPTGNAIIQVDAKGENAIIIQGGANQEITKNDVHRYLADFDAGDFLLVQNEVSAVPEMLQQASAKGMRVVFNPAPMTPAVLDYPLDSVSLFIVNETEGQALTGASEPEAILNTMREQYPRAAAVLTLGSEGVLFKDESTELKLPAEPVTVVDTTAAGDTFVGYLVAELLQGQSYAAALALAVKAAAKTVTKSGAAESIPCREDIL